MSLRGHLRSILPTVGFAVRLPAAPPARPWSTAMAEDHFGTVALTGRIRVPHDATALVVVVHGLGGSAESGYVRIAARAVDRLGLACLRLNLRGADGSGEDFYHAGLTADLRAAVADAALVAFSSIHILGYSLGGHLALRYACEQPDGRLASVAAVCAPLDLDAGATHLDRPAMALYRRYLLTRLARMYAPVAARRRLPVAGEEARRIRFIREWDERIVAPRHGFAGATDYYSRASAGPLLPGLAVPALLVVAGDDPMVPEAASEPWLQGASARLRVSRVAGAGHLGFPADTDLGENAPRGLLPQLLHWMTAQRP
ncbi:MAG: YheT family hydrolase [Acidobacteriota bacterium]